MLKFLGIQFVIMNICWFISMLLLYLDVKNNDWSFLVPDYYYPFWVGLFGAAYLDIFILSHWMFAMNYFMLAKRIQDE